MISLGWLVWVTYSLISTIRTALFLLLCAPTSEPKPLSLWGGGGGGGLGGARQQLSANRDELGPYHRVHSPRCYQQRQKRHTGATDWAFESTLNPFRKHFVVDTKHGASCQHPLRLSCLLSGKAASPPLLYPHAFVLLDSRSERQPCSSLSQIYPVPQLVDLEKGMQRIFRSSFFFSSSSFFFSGSWERWLGGWNIQHPISRHQRCYDDTDYL